MRPSRYLALLTLCIGVHVSQTYAQKTASPQSPVAFKARSWQIGLKEGYSRGNFFKNRNNLQLHAGYYPVNRLLVGVNGAWAKEWTGEVNYQDFLAGPYVRYHFTSTRLSPFIDASYQRGHRRAGDRTSITYPAVPIQSMQLTGGLNLAVINRLRFDVSYGLQWVYFRYRTEPLKQAQLGLSYLFASN